MTSVKPEDWGLAVRVIAAFVLLAMLLYYIPERAKGIAISVSSEYLAVDTIGDSDTEWEVPLIEACIRTDTPSATRSLKLENCEPSLYEGVRAEFPVLKWPTGYRLEFRSFDTETLEIKVNKSDDAPQVLLTDDRAITNGTLLRIPYGNERPLLPVEGFATIGQPPNASDRLILRHGVYEIRQKLLPWGKPLVVSDGAFFPGDKIDFLCRPSWPWSGVFTPDCDAGAPIPARLFITDLSSRSAAFELVVTTDRAFSELYISRVGDLPSYRKVTWSDRVLADSLPVALATILGLLGTIIALSNNYFSRNGKSKPKDDKTGES